MLPAVLYSPSTHTRLVLSEEAWHQDALQGLCAAAEKIAYLLGCNAGLVDVAASGQGDIACSVFGCEGEINIQAMEAVTALSGLPFDRDDDNDILKGPVLVLAQG